MLHVDVRGFAEPEDTSRNYFGIRGEGDDYFAAFHDSDHGYGVLAMSKTWGDVDPQYLVRWEFSASQLRKLARTCEQLAKTLDEESGRDEYYDPEDINDDFPMSVEYDGLYGAPDYLVEEAAQREAEYESLVFGGES